MLHRNHMTDATYSDEMTNYALTEQEPRIGDYFALLKPRVMSLVIFTGFAGMWIAPGITGINPILLAIGMLCLAVNAGAAGAISVRVPAQAAAGAISVSRAGAPDIICHRQGGNGDPLWNPLDLGIWEFP